MPTIKEYRGYVYVIFYNADKGYSTKKSLKIKATQENLRNARRDLKSGRLKVPELLLKNDVLDDGNENVTLSQILPLYFVYNNLSAHTRSIYTLAVRHFENAAGTKPVAEYKESDYLKLITYFQSLKIYNTKVNTQTKKKERVMVRLGASQNTISIYTRHLHAIFDFLLKKNQIKKNIIGRVPPSQAVPRPIDLEDMKLILDELKNRKIETDKIEEERKAELLKALTEKQIQYIQDKYSRKLKRLNDTRRDQYNLIYFLYNTGIRISTALALHWEDIQWQQNQILFRNIKVQGQEYTFPLTQKLQSILREIGVKRSGKIFP